MLKYSPSVIGFTIAASLMLLVFWLGAYVEPERGAVIKNQDNACVVGRIKGINTQFGRVIINGDIILSKALCVVRSQDELQMASAQAETLKD